MEQFATRHRRMQHTVTVPPWTENISVYTVLSFSTFVVTCTFICGPSSFYLGHVKKNCNVMYPLFQEQHPHSQPLASIFSPFWPQSLCSSEWFFKEALQFQLKMSTIKAMVTSGQNLDLFLSISVEVCKTWTEHAHVSSKLVHQGVQWLKNEVYFH